MKSFKEHLEEEVAANSVSGGGVDLTPFYKKRDKRKREDVDTMYRRSLGLKHINAMIEKRKK